jgi:membrane fusion protein (multidrug efflux system)
MADQPETVPLTSQRRFRIVVGLVVVLLLGVGAWLWLTAGRESTDDAQVDAHVTPIAARVGGIVLRSPVVDNQQVEAGAVLVELDPRDYQVAVAKARAELANAEADALAAQNNVPIMSTTASSNVTAAKGAVESAGGDVDHAQKELEAAHARLASAQARQRETLANATKATRDVERLRGLLAKDEVSQQQFDATTATADAQGATAEAAKAQITEAEAGIRVAEIKLMQARVGEQNAQASLRSAQTAPQQVAATQARAAAAEAHVQQAKAALEQAELNLQYTTIKAPQKGTISRKAAEAGQVIQAGQPLMALVPLETVWITANFKETQLSSMRPGQTATIKVDAYGGREFKGKIESIAAATGARFSLLPPENATGNYVKVVQRVPVKIVLDAAQDPEHLLRPGMSVVPTVYTK